MTPRPLRTAAFFGATGAAAASIAASICCVGPLAIAILGINGAILGAAVKPYRFYLLSASFVLIGGAFWDVYGRRRSFDGTACPVKRGRWTKLALWTALALWISAVVIQYLSYCLWLKGGIVL